MYCKVYGQGEPLLMKIGLRYIIRSSEANFLDILFLKSLSLRIVIASMI